MYTLLNLKTKSTSRNKPTIRYKPAYFREIKISRYKKFFLLKLPVCVFRKIQLFLNESALMLNALLYLGKDTIETAKS